MQEEKTDKETVLVTGASGFVGSYMVDELLTQGYKVKALVRETSNKSKLNKDGVELVIGDINDQSALEKATKDVSCVFHIAALFRKAGLPDSEFRRVNAEGTKAVLDASVKSKVPRFIHCSTVGVLGDVANIPANEQTKYNPGDIYQVTKMEGELIALDYFKKGLISGVVIRPAMIYGPEDNRTFKLFKMIAKKYFFYVGKGNALVHWIDVRDLVKAFVSAFKNQHLNSQIYIIAGEKAVPLTTMVDHICSILKVDKPWLHLPVVPMQIIGTICETICKPLNIEPPIFRRRVDFFTKNRSFDTSKAKQELGFKPQMSFQEEINDIIGGYQTTGKL